MTPSTPLLTAADFAGRPNPTGEGLLDRSSLPYLAWEPSAPLIVLGHSQEASRECDMEAARADGVPIYKRRGGGGAVVLAPGIVCFGIRFRKQEGLAISDYFERGSGFCRRAWRDFTDLELESRGVSDLCLGAKKVLGCSLYMPRDFVLYLASVLVEDLGPLLDRYLRHPSREPEYRHGRSHELFLTSLRAVRAGQRENGEKPRLEEEEPPLGRRFCGRLSELLEEDSSGDFDFPAV